MVQLHVDGTNFTGDRVDPIKSIADIADRVLIYIDNAILGEPPRHRHQHSAHQGTPHPLRPSSRQPGQARR